MDGGNQGQWRRLGDLLFGGNLIVGTLKTLAWLSGCVVALVWINELLG